MALEYLKAFDNGGMVSDGGIILGCSRLKGMQLSYRRYKEG